MRFASSKNVCCGSNAATGPPRPANHLKSKAFYPSLGSAICVQNHEHFRSRSVTTGNDGLQDVLVADDPDGVAIDLNRIDDRANIPLAGIGTASIELCCHQPGERIDLAGIDRSQRAALSASAIIGCPGSFAFVAWVA